MPRRSLPALLSLIAVPALLAGPARAGDLFRRGDVNADGGLDVSDAVSVFLALFARSPAPPCLDAADANDDGGVDISDGIRILDFLFRNGLPLPPPSFRARCAGPDPTADTLGCTGGEEPPGRPPEAEIRPVRANAPGVRQRSRLSLEEIEPGRYRVGEGVSFALLVEARSNRVSRAGFSFQRAGEPGDGDPETLVVRCDRDLGDPAAGGVPAGADLAPHFFRDLDGWRDRIYLLEHAALRIAGDGPLAPAPGEYRFTATVVDDACGRSAEAPFELVVEASARPEILAWVVEGPPESSPPRQHDAGTGNVRVEGEGFSLVIEGRGRDGAVVDPGSIRVTAEPPLPAGSDLTAFLEPIGGGEGTRFAMALAGERRPTRGNTDLRIELGAEAGGDVATALFRIEVPVRHEPDVQPIFTASCTGCHEEPDPFKGLVLVDPSPARVWRNIVNVYAAEPVIDSIAPLLVRPYFPERSYLFHKLRGTHLDPAVGGEGDRMPADEGYLDAAAERLIESWILQGAPP